MYTTCRSWGRECVEAMLLLAEEGKFDEARAVFSQSWEVEQGEAEGGRVGGEFVVSLDDFKQIGEWVVDSIECCIPLYGGCQGMISILTNHLEYMAPYSEPAPRSMSLEEALVEGWFEGGFPGRCEDVRRMVVGDDTGESCARFRQGIDDVLGRANCAQPKDMEAILRTAAEVVRSDEDADWWIGLTRFGGDDVEIPWRFLFFCKYISEEKRREVWEYVKLGVDQGDNSEDEFPVILWRSEGLSFDEKIWYSNELGLNLQSGDGISRYFLEVLRGAWCGQEIEYKVFTDYIKAFILNPYFDNEIMLANVCVIWLREVLGIKEA